MREAKPASTGPGKDSLEGQTRRGEDGTETAQTSAFPASSGHTTAANYTDLPFSLFQKGFAAHQVLGSAICVSLEMTSSVAFKGKKPHVSTYLRDQLASSCQTDMLEGERKEISHKNNGHTTMADLSLGNIIFRTSAVHRAVYFTSSNEMKLYFKTEIIKLTSNSSELK